MLESHEIRRIQARLVALALLAGVSATAFAQAPPTTQPQFLHIFREQIKPGRAAEHAQWEAGWPAAAARAKSPYSYLALASLTGPLEVWYVTAYASQAAFGESMAWEAGQPALTAESERLSKGDAEFLADANALQAVAIPELSHGAFPDIGTMRFWEITTFRVRPGHEDAWVAATGAYKAASARSAPAANWRTYRVLGGAPDGTYLVFSSVASFGDFDKMMADGEATMKGASPEEMELLTKFMKEGVINVSSNRYRLDPKQSYVDAATKAKDPAFWNPKP